MLEKFFKLSDNGTDVKTEVMAGITTFMTMAYILAVNPSIMAAAGMDQGAVFTATALASLIGTLLMAFLANYPFALAPGMGLNAYFAYTVVLGMGYSWQVALTAVFAEGIIFIILSLTNVREAIFNAIPQNLKAAVSVGIGLFIAFIGLQNAKIVIGGSTLLQLFSVENYNLVNGVEASFQDVGITVLLAIIGIIITGILVIRNIKGNILWGILITWVLGIICQLAGLYVPNPELGFYGLLPDFSAGLSVPSLEPIFGKLDFSNVFSLNFIVVIFAFLFVDMFDTIGTLIGVSSKANMLDEEGEASAYQGRASCGFCRDNGGRRTWHFNDNDLCGERFRRIGRRTYRSYGSDNSDSFWACSVFVTDFPCDSVFCHGSGSCSSWFLYAHECSKY